MESSLLRQIFKKREKGLPIKNEEEEIAKNVETFCHDPSFFDLPLHSIASILNYPQPIKAETIRHIVSTVSKRNGSSSVILLRYFTIADPTFDNIIDILSNIRGCPIFENLRRIVSNQTQNFDQDLEDETNKIDENKGIKYIDSSNKQNGENLHEQTQKIENKKENEEDFDSLNDVDISNRLLEKYDDNIKIRGYIEDIVFTENHQNKNLLSKMKDPIFSDYAYQCILYAQKIRPHSLLYLKFLLELLPFDPPDYLSLSVEKFERSFIQPSNPIENKLNQPDNDQFEEEISNHKNNLEENQSLDEIDDENNEFVIQNDENSENSIESQVKQAIKSDDLETLKEILTNNLIVSVYCKETDSKITPLCLAAFYGSSECFRYLYLNSKQEINERLVRYAIKGGNYDIFNICANNGFDFHGFGKTAAKYHRNDILSWILTNYGFEKVPPSTCISSCNTPALFYFLKKLGVDYTDKYGENCFTKCCSRGEIDIVDYLYSKKANIEYRNSSGQTGLSIASENGHIEIINYLIENGANLENKDNYGRTPLIVASENGQVHSILALLENGADIEAQTITGITPLISAVIRNKKEAVKVLIEHGADPNKTDNIGKSSLVRAKDPEILEILKSKLNP
ncbi:hypothetical protein TVAG_173290 [Trichomonas vaginalis G3]|uniref:DUF3447 domain-containing protein n=1 Tax=Trichomonas vaginalis (strain ATCC PRA-98 / G3) TaxID=412133 RepID=A2DF79_TRIV3|nr:protein ubiquitination [Trichomonas vaginalis G3]EAY21071.1 hypothetical protein TVAG_173290 [Trichomonas vaginalis G3]KAI5532819.1 protein ubiquitination [Trichomonas vaginalis G3]|eukprot:XP_001582057.1 hypothetical protein [Trichomonas vaginalis G3]